MSSSKSSSKSAKSPAPEQAGFLQRIGFGTPSFFVGTIIALLFSWVVQSVPGLPTFLTYLMNSVFSFSSSFLLVISTALLIIVTTILLIVLYLFLFHKPSKNYIASPKFISSGEENTQARRKKVKSINAANAKTTTEGLATKAETVNWMNQIADSILQRYLFPKASHIKDTIIQKLNKEIELPDVLGNVDLKCFDLGSTTPVFHSIAAQETKNGLEIEFDVEYEDDHVKFEVATEVYINFPSPKFVSLPVKIAFENFYFRGKIHLQLSPDFKQLQVYFVEEPEYDIIFSNAFGDNYALQNLPKITELINSQIHSLLTQKLVKPNVLTIDLEGALPPTGDASSSSVTKKPTPKAAESDEGEDSAESEEEEVVEVRKKTIKKKLKAPQTKKSSKKSGHMYDEPVSEEELRSVSDTEDQ